MDGLFPTPIYLLTAVQKRYGGARALAPCYLQIDQGERVALAGPSGAGKSTLLSILAGLLPPTSGLIEIEGRPLSSLKPGQELSRLVGMVHQQLDLVPHLSVKHNVLAGRLGQWSLGRSFLSLLAPQELSLAQTALERMGIGSKLHERTSRLSGGEQQRVAFARVLVQNPKVILADEPVSSLDPARARDLMTLLSQTVQESGKTLIASLHSVGLARDFFTRIIGLRDGAVLFDMPTHRVDDDVLDELYRLEGLPV